MSNLIQQICSQMQVLEISSEGKIGMVAKLMAPLLEQKVKNFGGLKMLYESILFSHKCMSLTLEAIQKMKFSEFDGLVGDCACQIRALFVAKFFQQELSSRKTLVEYKALQATLRQSIETLKTKIGQIKEKDLVKPLPNALSFQDLLTQEGLEVKVAKKLFIMNDAFLLNAAKSIETVVKMENAKKVFMLKEVTDEKRLACLVASGASSSILKEAKKRLAEVSVRFIEKEASTLTLDALTKSLVAQKREVQGRKELPCIATCQVVFQKALAEDISVLVKVRRATSLFENPRDPYDAVVLFKPIEGQDGSKRFIPVNPRKKDLDFPLLVIEGQRSDVSCQKQSLNNYLGRLLEHDLLSLIHLNAVGHKQYSQEKEKVGLPRQLQEELGVLVARAERLGCTHDQQRLMTITHIFCDTLSNQYVDLGISERHTRAIF